jgi:predicted nucleotidyltransferase
MKKEIIINIVTEHKQELKDKFGVEKIGLFGSYARGEENYDSDIDFVVELSKPDLFCLIGVKYFLEDILNSKVDIVRYREKMNEFLRNRILSDAIYV